MTFSACCSVGRIIFFKDKFHVAQAPVLTSSCGICGNPGFPSGCSSPCTHGPFASTCAPCPCRPGAGCREPVQPLGRPAGLPRCGFPMASGTRLGAEGGPLLLHGWCVCSEQRVDASSGDTEKIDAGVQPRGKGEREVWGVEVYCLLRHLPEVALVPES